MQQCMNAQHLNDVLLIRCGQFQPVTFGTVIKVVVYGQVRKQAGILKHISNTAFTNGKVDAARVIKQNPITKLHASAPWPG